MRIHLIISGKVQGVWYRKSAVDMALKLGLTGWAMNRADGSVEIEAQGSEGAVNAMHAWCEQGPPLAKVDRVVWQEINEVFDEETGFRIRHEN